MITLVFLCVLCGFVGYFVIQYNFPTKAQSTQRIFKELLQRKISREGGNLPTGRQER